MVEWFWDTDLWMLNGILPFAPDHIKSFINYRVHLHQQAIDNVPRGIKVRYTLGQAVDLVIVQELDHAWIMSTISIWQLLWLVGSCTSAEQPMIHFGICSMPNHK